MSGVSPSAGEVFLPFEPPFNDEGVLFPPRIKDLVTGYMAGGVAFDHVTILSSRSAQRCWSSVSCLLRGSQPVPYCKDSGSRSFTLDPMQITKYPPARKHSTKGT